MPTLPVHIPIKVLRLDGLPCSTCDTETIELDVYSLDNTGAELVATLVGCINCKTGLCRET